VTRAKTITQRQAKQARGGATKAPTVGQGQNTAKAPQKRYATSTAFLAANPKNRGKREPCCICGRSDWKSLDDKTIHASTGEVICVACLPEPGRKPAAAPRRAKEPRKRPGRKPKTARTRALEVLTKVGATPDDPRVQGLAQCFRNVEANIRKAIAENLPCSCDIEAIERAIEGVKLKNRGGRAYRTGLLKRIERDRIRSWLSLFLPGGGAPTEESLRDARLLKRILGEAKRGHPTAIAPEQTILLAKEKYGWDWEVCAAAVFVTEPDERDGEDSEEKRAGRYESIKKSFRDVARRVARNSEESRAWLKAGEAFKNQFCVVGHGGKPGGDELREALGPAAVIDPTSCRVHTFVSGEQRECVLVPPGARSKRVSSKFPSDRWLDSEAFAELMIRSGFVASQIRLDGKNTRVWQIIE
jgi:hypothetical protein